MIVDVKRDREALQVMKDVLSEIRKNGVSTKEMEIAKNYIRGQRLLEQESVSSQAQQIAAIDVLGLGYNYLLQREERLKNVTNEDIMEIAEKYFHADNYFVHILK